MPLIEVPLDSLLFCLNSTWAWLALFFAAFSFYRIRVTGSVAKPHPKPEPIFTTTTSSSSYIRPENAVQVVQVAKFHVEDNGVTKGKFTSYFYSTESEEEEDVAAEVVDGRVVEKMKERKGDLGWYRHVDLTAFDGSVVRLWDCSCESW